MLKREHRIGNLGKKVIAGAAALATTLLITPPTFATCYGTWYDYYETPACVQWVGTTVRCPGYPDQHDEDVNGNWVETPYFITQTVVCPCPGSGGGGGSGGPGEDGEAPPD